MTEAARMAWIDIYNEITEEQPGAFGAVCNRAEPQTLRLAMIYALLDCAKQIDVVHLRAALALWKYCEASAKFIFGDLLGDPVADAILLALRRQGDDGLSRNDIYEMFGRNKSKSAITDALQKLFTAGKATKYKRGNGRGRPEEVWKKV